MAQPFESLDDAPVGEGPRSPGPTYQDILDLDTREVPEVLRWQSARDLPVTRVPVDRYFSREFHDLEMEKMWGRVWQVACREEEIPEPGDRTVYEIGDASVVIVRGEDQTLRAFHNVCKHRGRRIVDGPGRSPVLRCPFHRWTWDLKGRPADIPCAWDFKHATREDFLLPKVALGTWGGFVFVNLDPDCGPLEAHLGDLPKHFTPWPLEDRYSEAHVARVMPCNWKVLQEAFMEAYHVIATHPQIMAAIGDCNSQYDAWDTFSRAISPQMVPSPHLSEAPDEQVIMDAMTGGSLDAHSPFQVPEGMTARQLFAQVARMGMQAAVPSVQKVSDAELCDSIYYTLFPNFHPWGAYNKITYRFRPFENDPNRSVMEVWLLAPYRSTRPAPAKLRWLDVDEPWSEAPELGNLGNIFDQDSFNLGKVQKGLRAAAHSHVTFASYQETKIRHFHSLLDKYLAG